MSDNTIMWAILCLGIYGGAMTCACAFLLGEVAALKKKNSFVAPKSSVPAAMGFAPDPDQGIFPAKPMSEYTVAELEKMSHGKQALEHEAWILSRPAYVSAGEQGEYEEILRARMELAKRNAPYTGPVSV